MISRYNKKFLKTDFHLSILIIEQNTTIIFISKLWFQYSIVVWMSGLNLKQNFSAFFGVWSHIMLIENL